MQARAVAILNVSHDKRMISPGKHEQVTIRFELTQPAVVRMDIFDSRDLLIKTIGSRNMLMEGEHALSWDGHDELGRVVPSEIYRYTLSAYVEGEKRAEYDISDLTGGEKIIIDNIKWNPDKKHIEYLLPKAVRVNLRIGIKNNGPMLRTLVNWEPRMPGFVKEEWDGFDQSRLVDLSHHKDILVTANAYSLSDNAIFVDAGKSGSRFIDEISWGREKRNKKTKKKFVMRDYARKGVEELGDFPIILTVPVEHPVTGDDVPVLSGTVPIMLDLPEKVLSRVISQRFECAVFMDGKFYREVEVGVVPMTWFMDLSNITPGVHYITANIFGYEGNFGTGTVKFVVPGSKP